MKILNLALILGLLFAATPEELLALMTLQEKAGQMTQAERGDLIEGDIARYAIGSVVSGGGSSPDPNAPERWRFFQYNYLEETLQTNLKIPIIYGIDAVHGNNNVYGATIFPHNINYGATAVGSLETGLENVADEGAAVMSEVKGIGVSWMFAPVLGNPQDIHWGRSYEGYSENISIPTLLAPAFVTAVQSTNEVASCVKHYIGEGFTTNGVNQGNAILTDDQVRELLPPYAAAVQAGSLTIMPSYNTINGVKCTENKFILQTLLKDELGFKGFVISGWGAVDQCSGRSYKHQLANTINAGLDMVMATVNGRQGWINTINAIVDNVNDGSIPIERIDDAVLRILRVKEKLGLLKQKYDITKGGVGNHRTLARNHVADSLVLLKNKGAILNTLAAGTSFLVAGQGADDVGMQCGGWTLTWQGNHGPIVPGTSILAGLNTLSRKTFTYSENATQVGTYDAAIVVVGEDPYAESNGDRVGEIGLRAKDQAVLQNVYRLGVPVVVIILSGRPLNIGDEAENWDAAIAAFLPGTEAGGGIADVLFGEKDFIAKTPYTWRKTNGGEVLYPYGYGLTKTTETAE